MTAPRKSEDPLKLEDVRNRARARKALAAIAARESEIDKLSGPELAFVTTALEWFAGLPAKP